MKNIKNNKVILDTNGCDDDTYSLLELDDKELEFLINVCKKNNENSGYCCMPRLYIYKYKVGSKKYKELDEHLGEELVEGNKDEN